MKKATIISMVVTISRSRLSSWLLLFMLIILSAGFFVVEFMQIPLENKHQMNQFRVLIKQEFLKEVNLISLKNKIGQFDLQKPDRSSSWLVTSPRKLPASDNTVTAIFTLLENIRVLKLYDNEPINRSNFSLENPYLSIEVATKNNIKYTIDFGLINPIDGTSYIYASNTDHIYHIDEIDISLATLDLNDIVDGRVFIFSPSRVSSLTISRISGGGSLPTQQLKQVDKSWIDLHKKTIPSEIVMEYLNELSSIKSTLILDSLTEEQLKEIGPMRDNLQYELSVKDIDENTTTFNISQMVNKNISDYKIEKNKTILIHNKGQGPIYVLNRDISKLLKSTLGGQGELSIKKLFY